MRNTGKPKALFSIIDSALNPTVNHFSVTSVSLCEDFANYFNDKIFQIKSLLPSSAYSPLDVPLCYSTWSVFEPITLDSLESIFAGLKPTSCPQDVIPTSFLKQVFTTIGPDLLTVINKCLSAGVVPDSLKHASVSPLLKKSNLNPSILSNFRPISNLPFISKILEKVVLNQLLPFLNDNNIHEKFQSGFKAHHSTESALLRVMNAILLSTDTGQSVALVLLDLSSAFDLMDHNILLTRLEACVGFRGMVLQWFRSYLSNRSYSVSLGHHSSSVKKLSSGVPQGSILGPVLFNLYMLTLGSILSRHGVSFHLYADDTQIYLPIKRDDKLAFKSILECLDELKLWLASNFLCLNESKSEIILFGSNDHSSPDVELDTLLPQKASCVRNLGFLLDNSLKLDKQIGAVVKSCFYHLRLKAKVKPFLTDKNLETVMHAFISSCLDYCNSLYIGASQSCISRLQLVQNAAARLLKGKRKSEHITPVLISLHWLPVKYRIDFKVLLFVYKSLRNQAPQYLSELLHRPSQSRALRSGHSDLLFVPRTRLKNRGDRAFAVIGPKLWNSLPAHIKAAQTLSIFKSALKTYFFSLAFNVI